MINEIGMMVVAAVVGQLVIGVMTVVGGYRLLAQRIDQQEEIMRTVLNNGIRADIGKLAAQVELYARELATLDATCKERHRNDLAGIERAKTDNGASNNPLEKAPS